MSKMEVDMNKKVILFLTTLLCSNVIPMVHASSESMYQDIIQFCNTSNDTSSWPYTHSLNEAIKFLNDKRQNLFKNMMNDHTAKVDLTLSLLAGGCSVLFSGLGGIDLYRSSLYTLKSELASKKFFIAGGIGCLAIASSFACAALYNLYHNKISAYFCKKKITEIDGALKKLKAFQQKLHGDNIFKTPTKTEMIDIIEKIETEFCKQFKENYYNENYDPKDRLKLDELEQLLWKLHHTFCQETKMKIMTEIEKFAREWQGFLPDLH